jgi:hypothetical protein
VYVPVDVVKERLQVQSRLLSGKEVSGVLPMYRSTTHALKTILETEGVRGVYRVSGPLVGTPQHQQRVGPPALCFLQGYGATLLSFGPFSAFYFAFYEQVRIFSRR